MTRKLTHKELLARQEVSRQVPRLPFAVILNDIRSLYNVGSIFRTADGVGVEKIWLCGITGFPPDSKISKTALGAEASVAWEYCKSVLECVKKLKEENYKIVLLEQTVKSISYEEFSPAAPVALLLGNEISGIHEELVSLCDTAIEIPMTGLKNSLNVTVAFGVVAYHFRQQLCGRSLGASS
ncbi:MAG: RNA methyltransferase [Candidatus Omnitrophica bacterium]|nr:RNA methyltransferase [Candidatus Omnitrophota bacterium]